MRKKRGPRKESCGTPTSSRRGVLAKKLREKEGVSREVLAKILHEKLRSTGGYCICYLKKNDFKGVSCRNTT